MSKKYAVGVMNGNFRSGAYLKREDLTSPRDDVLEELKRLMKPAEYRKFFNAVYSKYRWSDTARYEKILRGMLKRIQRGR